MQTTKSTRFISHLVAAEIKQRIRSLTLRAEQARSVRNFVEVGSIAHSLRELPLPRELEGIASYYQACADRGDNGGPEILAALTESPLPNLRARAHLALGTNALTVADLSLAGSYYKRARAEFVRCCTPDLIGVLHLSQMEAVVTAQSGDHSRALNDLQGLWGLARVVMRSLPPVGYGVMNSIATELGANGQREFALALITTVTASPFVRIYPEWLDTRDEIAQSDRDRRYFPGGEAEPDTSQVFELAGYYERRAREREQEIDSIRSQIIASVAKEKNLDPKSGKEILGIIKRAGSGRVVDLEAARSFLANLATKNRRQSEG